MLLPLDGRNIAYDLVGPETGPVVCMTHSLASDGGMWTEQVPPLLAAGFRVLRIDMRGHGGSGPIAGDYTMSALAADVAMVLDALSIARVHFIGLSIGGMLGQAFALEHGGRLASAMWCDTLPSTPAGAPEVWPSPLGSPVFLKSRLARYVERLSTMNSRFPPACVTGSKRLGRPVVSPRAEAVQLDC